MTTDAPDALAADFPGADHDQWRALVDQVLDGADFERALTSVTYDGIRLQPLYVADAPHRPAPVAPVALADPTGRDGQWHVCARIDHPDPAVAAGWALDDLEGGASSLELALDVGGAGEVDGVVVVDLDDLDRVLDGVLLDVAAIRLAAGSAGPAAAAMLVGLWERRGVDAASRQGSLGLDPLGALAVSGRLPGGLDAALSEVASAAAMVAASPHVTAATVDASVYAAAGAAEGQELGAALATAVAYLRALTDAGIDLDAAAARIDVVVAADSDIYATVAKLRALRVCWAHLLEASGAADPLAPLTVTVRTNPSALSSRDVWVNLLRVTAGCFAAAVGGAQAVIAAPFDAPLGAPDGLARRMARNTQLVLAGESHLARVADPAAGSWFIEQYTDDLAATAWAEFVAIEAAGGIGAALVDGSWRDRIAATAEARRARVATRRDPLTGLSEFPFLDEPAVTRPVPDRDALRRAARERSGVAASADGADTLTTAPALQPVPRGADFEELRDRSDRLAASTGRRPTIFLANLGPAASHGARAGFATNLFEAGGIAAPANEGFDDDEALVAAFLAARTPLAVICGADAVYAERAEATAAALVAAGATWVALAGRPGDAEAAYRAAGVNRFVFVGVDVIDVVTDALATAGLDAGAPE